MRDEIVTFGIPLIAKAAAHDWDAVLHHLNATLGSIYNQTDPHFRVVIACSDRLDLNVETDERLHFVHCDPIRQINQLSFVGDQSHKNHAVGRYLRELGGGYLFGTDADDLISNRVVEFIRADRNPNGYVVDRGYMFDAARGLLARFPFDDAGDWRFDHECGTCTAVHFHPEELPARDGDPARYRAYRAHGHPGRRPAAAAEGRPLADFPFRAVTYVKNTGENLSERRSKGLELERLAFQARLEDGIIRNKVERTAELDTEFNLRAAEGFAQRKPSSGVDLVGLGFSVCVVTYKRPERLRRLLASLKPQAEGRSDREIIVVNDGSHDAAYQDVVDEFGDLIRYVPLAANVGIAAARNSCVAEAAGEYVVFTDDDCVAPPWWLDWLASRLAKSPEVDVVAGTTEPLWRTKGFFERVQAHFRLLPESWMTPDRPVFVTACVAIRRATFRRAGGFGFEPHTYAGEDTELAVRIGRQEGRIVRDRLWHVMHELDGLRAHVRRNWRYGYANGMMVGLGTAPARFEEYRKARRRNHLKHASQVFRDLWWRSAGFSDRRLARLVATLAVLPVRIAFYDGCAVAARNGGGDRARAALRKRKTPKTNPEGA